MNANTCTFTPDTMTINGIEFPAGYSIPPHGDGSVFVFVQQGEQQIRVRITPDDPHHAAALAAARPDPDRPPPRLDMDATRLPAVPTLLHAPGAADPRRLCPLDARAVHLCGFRRLILAKAQRCVLQYLCKEVENTMSKHYEQRKEANARWAAKQERFCMYLDPTDKADIAAYAKAKGESMTAFLLRCAKAEMERNPLSASFDETCR